MVQARRVAASLEHAEMTGQVGMGIGKGIIDRVAHPGLSGQMDDAVRAAILDQCSHGIGIGNIHPYHLEALVRGQGRGARLFQGGIIIGVEDIDADNLLARCKEPFAHGPADKSCRTGHKKGHGSPNALQSAHPRRIYGLFAMDRARFLLRPPCGMKPLSGHLVPTCVGDND